MKTNQTMEVKIGNYGSILIGHKDQMGNVQDVINMANMSDKMKGGKGGYVIHQALQSVDLWKYIIEVEVIRIKNLHNDNNKNPLLSTSSNSCDSHELSKSLISNGKTIMADYGNLSLFVDDSGHVNYKTLMKMFPYLIKSKRGRYGGTWANLQILLKIAGNVDKAIEAMAYKTLVESQILQHRDLGGNSFKLLLKPKGNRGCYIQAAKIMRAKLKILDSKGYNETEHDGAVQEMRDDIQSKMISFVDIGFVTTWSKFKLTLAKV